MSIGSPGLRICRRQQRQGFALLFSLFIISLVTLMVVNILDSATLELSVLRNSMDYERALYLANAGVHHAAAMLEDDDTWRTTVESNVSYGADDTYEATFLDGLNQTVIVTSKGKAGDIERTVVATIEL